MNASMAGALIGFVIGLSGFFTLRFVAHRIEQTQEQPTATQAANILRYAAIADVVIFTVLGYFVGPMMMNTTG